MGRDMENGGKKGELSFIASKTSGFPIPTHTTKWFQVRCQNIRGKRSARALKQSYSSQEWSGDRGLGPQPVTLQSGQGSGVRVRRSADLLNSHFHLESGLGLEAGVRRLTQTLTQSHFGLGSGPQRFPPAL